MNFVEDFRVPLWLFNGHLQTIWPATVGKKHLRREVRPSYFREKWKTPDNDFIEIDFNQNFYKERNPIVVLFHGLEGSSSSYYSLAFYQACKELKFSLSIPHFRGCSGPANELPRSYHAGDSEEINWILEKYSKICAEQNRELYVFGVSLGGNALLHWAGTYVSNSLLISNLRCIVSICAPINLRSSGLAIDRKINRLVYANYFLRSMKRKARDKWYQYPDDFSFEKVQNARTIYEFDNSYTAPVHGFLNVEDYWQKASAAMVIEKIRVKTLLINSRNDPIVPFSSLPHSEISQNQNIETWYPTAGGHVCFVHSPKPTHLSTDNYFFPKSVLNWCKNQCY